MYKVVNSIDDLPQFDPDKPLFSDIETGYLYKDFRMIQFYQPDTSEHVYIVDIAPMGYDHKKYPEELQRVKNYIKEHWLVFWNASYDLGTLNTVPAKVDDLFYATKIAYAEFQEFGLKNVVKKFPETKALYANTEETHGKNAFVPGAYISGSALRYAATDVIALAMLWDKPKIQNIIQNNTAYKVDILSLEYAIQYQQNGLYIDHNLLKEKYEFAKEKVDYYSALLPQGFNPNSYKQVRALLDTDKSDHAALVRLAAKDERAKWVLELRKYKKQMSYMESLMPYDYMLTRFNVYGAQTGRFTSTGGDIENGINAQQIPRELQSLFKQPVEINGVKTKVVGLDYSTLELRLACTIFGSKYMYKQLKEGQDLHTAMAAMLNNKPMDQVTKDERQKAKAVNFGLVYGMSSSSLVEYAFTAYGVVMTPEEAKKIRDKYFSIYPEFKAYHNWVWENYKKPNFFIYTALDRKIKPKLGTDGINAAVQGTGAEVTKLAVHYLVKEDERALKYIFNVVHDSISMRVPEEDYDYWTQVLTRNMVKAWEEMSKTKAFKFKDIPMPVAE